MRRRAILKAARRLVRDEGSLNFSLAQLASRSGVSKPNTYRYFESREAVLLSLWLEELADLASALETSLATIASGDHRAVVATLVAAFESRPLLCELTSVASPVLERNLSAEPILEAKLALRDLTLRIASLLHARLPRIAPDDCAWLASATATYVAGLWPAAYPGKSAEEAYAKTAAGPPVFARELTRLLDVLVEGLDRRA